MAQVRRVSAGRWMRTVAPLRPWQWTGRAARHVGPALRSRSAHRARRDAATVQWRTDFAPRWPEIVPGAGDGDADDWARGEGVLHGFIARRGHWHGPDRLGAYQLQAFDLVEPLLTAGRVDAVLDWMTDWAQRHPIGTPVAWDPWVVSRRLQRWIVALSLTPTRPHRALAALQAAWLSRHLEFALGGNHLWENGVALALAGEAFEGAAADHWRWLGARVLHGCLERQILPHGGHAEQSAMYHGVLRVGLDRLVAAQMATNRLDPRVAEAASAMARWEAQTIGPRGRRVQFHDTAPGVAPDRPEGSDVAAAFDGLVVIRRDGVQLAFDAAPVHLSHQPGHVHASALSFELVVDGRPIVVDPGTAGYDDDPHRLWSRQTRAHPTPTVDDRDSAEVWASFRMGRRPRVVGWGPEPIPVLDGWGYRCGGSHDGFGGPLSRVITLRVTENAVRVDVDDRWPGSGRVTSRIPLAPGLDWHPDSGSLARLGTLIPRSGRRHQGAGRVSAGFRRWEPATVAIADDAGERSGWQLEIRRI